METIPRKKFPFVLAILFPNDLKRLFPLNGAGGFAGVHIILIIIGIHIANQMMLGKII